MSSTNRDSQLRGRPIFANNARADGPSPYDILDSSWIKSSFMISENELSNEADLANRYWSTASSKFTDGRLGGNFGINNPPQYTPYCDYPQPGRLAGRVSPTPWDSTGNYGWGTYYSEAVDDTKQSIFLRFGVPQFNSLLNYFMNAFDSNQSTLARTGRMPSSVYTAAKLLGTYVAVVAVPAAAVTVLAGRVVSFFFNRSSSKFYTMKPTMFLYWSTVNTLANTLAVNMGIFPKILNMNSDDTQKLGKPFVTDQAYLDAFSAIAPDVFGGQNYFDIHSIANRAQRLANQVHTEEYENASAENTTNYVGYLQRELSGDGTHSTSVQKKDGQHRLSDLLDETFKLSKVFEAKTNDPDQAEKDPRIATDSPDASTENKSWMAEYAAYFDAEFRMGSQFAIFNVDYTGPVTTSFSNTTGQSQLAEKLNSTSSTVREVRFSLAEGNVIGGLVKDAQDLIGDAVSGAIAGATMDMGAFLKGIMGDGFVDIPEHWMNSGVQLPETTYSMTLTATYNTPLSRMMKLYIPICMLMAGALPRSIGKQSYTSPFLCQVFDKGRAQIRLGMIKSLSITAGSGSNIGFDQMSRPLSFDVSFTISDLSSVMHMPVSGGSLNGLASLATGAGAVAGAAIGGLAAGTDGAAIGAAAGGLVGSSVAGGADMTLDEDNILSDYLAVLASQDIYTQIYPMAAARMRLAKAAIAAGKWTSPAFWAAATYDSSTSGVLKYLTLGAGVALEGVVRGNETTLGR